MGKVNSIIYGNICIVGRKNIFLLNTDYDIKLKVFYPTLIQCNWYPHNWNFHLRHNLSPTMYVQSLEKKKQDFQNIQTLNKHAHSIIVNNS